MQASQQQKNGENRIRKIVADLDAVRMGIASTKYGIKYAYFMN